MIGTSIPEPDRQEEHSCRQQQHQRAACAMCRPPGGVVKPQYAQVAPRHASEDRRGDQQLQQELAGRDARQRLFGRGEVLQHGAVEREGPVFVEGEVGGERRGGDGGDDEQVTFQHAAAPSPRNPEGCEHDQERQCGDVSRYGLVEFQSVPDDQRQLCGRSFGRLRVLLQLAHCIIGISGHCGVMRNTNILQGILHLGNLAAAARRQHGDCHSAHQHHSQNFLEQFHLVHPPCLLLQLVAFASASPGRNAFRIKNSIFPKHPKNSLIQTSR